MELKFLVLMVAEEYMGVCWECLKSQKVGKRGSTWWNFSSQHSSVSCLNHAGSILHTSNMHPRQWLLFSCLLLSQFIYFFSNVYVAKLCVYMYRRCALILCSLLYLHPFILNLNDVVNNLGTLNCIPECSGVSGCSYNGQL